MSTSIPARWSALLGHNGAGKSTLIKVLSACLQARFAASIRVGGNAVRRSSRSAGRQGATASRRSTRTLARGRQRRRRRQPLPRDASADDDASASLDDADDGASKARAVMDRTELRISAAARSEVKALSGGQRQSVAIAPRGLCSTRASSSWTSRRRRSGRRRRRKVGDLVRQLKSEGIGIFLISHDIHDVFDLADRHGRASSHGRVVGTARTADVSKDEVLGDDHPRQGAAWCGAGAGGAGGLIRAGASSRGGGAVFRRPSLVHLRIRNACDISCLSGRRDYP
jgi:D-xylose transport system ATP-binding protein